MTDKNGNKITVGAIFKLVGSNTIHRHKTGIVQKICKEFEPHSLVGSFADKEPVMQIGIGEEPVVDMELRFPMRVYPWEIEIDG